MSIKISALTPAGSVSGSEEFPIVQDGETVKATIYGASRVPTAVYDNSAGDILLNNWGLWDSNNACTTLNAISLDDPADYPGKVLYLRNTISGDIPFATGSLVDVDGSAVSVLRQNGSVVAVSNGVDWLVVASYSI
jgi:hypothetical protein